MLRARSVGILGEVEARLLQAHIRTKDAEWNEENGEN
jgi:hypothetical protein